MENLKSPDWFRFAGFYTLASLIFAASYIVLYIYISSPIIGTFGYPVIVVLLSLMLMWLCLFPYFIEKRGSSIGLLLFGAGISVLISITILFVLWIFGTIATSAFMSNYAMDLFTLSIRYFCVFFIGFGFSAILRKVRDISVPTQIFLGLVFGILFILGIWGLSSNTFWNTELLAINTVEGTPNWSGQVFWLPITLLFPGCILGCSITIFVIRAIKRFYTRKYQLTD